LKGIFPFLTIGMVLEKLRFSTGYGFREDIQGHHPEITYADYCCYKGKLDLCYQQTYRGFSTLFLSQSTTFPDNLTLQELKDELENDQRLMLNQPLSILQSFYANHLVFTVRNLAISRSVEMEKRAINEIGDPAGW